VPGTSERDTIGYKIEALRYYLENKIGFEQFMKVYQMIEVIIFIYLCWQGWLRFIVIS